MFNGYVIIKVSGLKIEKFISICMHRKLVFLDVIRNGNTIILKMPAKDFKAIRGVVRKTGCKVKILEKKGFSFWIRRYKNRKSFLVGCIVFISIFTLLWSYIWDIEIIGCTDDAKIMKYLDDNNIKIGNIKYRIDTKKIENDIMLEFDDLAWVKTQIKGTKLIVELVNREKKPIIIDKNSPCDIIAIQDGVITKVLVKNGMENVKIGDTVLKGDVLISGIVEPKTEFGDTRIVHAIGSVKAKTWYEETEEVCCVKTKKIYTGDVFKKYRITVFGKNIFTLSGKEKNNNYVKTNRVVKLRLPRNFILPIQIIEEKRKYYNKHQEVVTMYKARQEAKKRATELILKRIPHDASILNQKVKYFSENGKIYVNVIFEVCQEISKEKLIE